MGKPVEVAARAALRCVHCRTTETPLWRTGPDGAKTLCNACGVRFKKGKLILYRNDAGNLTAIKQTDSEPVVVPPPPKKALKPKKPTNGTDRTASAAAGKVAGKTVSKPSAQTTTVGGRHPPSTAPPSMPPTTGPVSGSNSLVRKIPSETCIGSTVAKKVRNRARRMTAGQMPGRYHSASRAASLADADIEHMHCLPSPSPPLSLRSAPSSPGPFDDGFCLRTSSLHISALDVHGPSPYQFSDPACESDTNVFPDVACLGLGGEDDDVASAPVPQPTLSLPSMAADPSSAEQFSFSDSDSVFAPDPSLVIDPLGQRAALAALVRDKSRSPCRIFHACTRALAALGFRLIENGTLPAAPTAAERRSFVRAFISEHSAAAAGENMSLDLMSDDEPRQPSHPAVASRLPFPDRTAYDTAVDTFRAMADCNYLAIFSDALVQQLLEEEVDAFMASPAKDADPAGCIPPQLDGAAGKELSARA